MEEPDRRDEEQEERDERTVISREDIKEYLIIERKPKRGQTITSGREETDIKRKESGYLMQGRGGGDRGAKPRVRDKPI